jgi:DNA-binding MarR family transcriptional regulator
VYTLCTMSVASASSTLPCICSSLRKAARVASRRYDDALRPAGLRITQFDVLSTVWQLKQAILTVLAKELVLERTSLARELSTLERDGLVRIEVGTDPRTRVVSLTSSGTALVEFALPLWQSVQNEVLGDLGPKQVMLRMLSAFFKSSLCRLNTNEITASSRWY